MITAECNDNGANALAITRLRTSSGASGVGGDVAKTTAINAEIIGQAIDMAAPNKRLIFIIVVAAAGYFFDSFDISIMAYALPSVAKEFQLVPQQLGLVGSAGLAGMAVGSWVWGLIADRWGRTLVFAATVLTFSLFTGV